MQDRGAPHKAARTHRCRTLFSQPHVLRNLLATAAVVGLGSLSILALATDPPPNIPPVELSNDPLYTPAIVDKPTIALALSVEYPTVGAQYVDPDNNNGSTIVDPTYSPSIEYPGYYDAESCYVYDAAGTGAPAGQADSYKRFVRSGSAIPLSKPDLNNPTWTSRICWDGRQSYTKDSGTTPASNDAFSGNFLNWASSSAIDMLRLSLTGGDRVIDTPTLTVLQRAVLPDGDPIRMGNSANFPTKRLYRSGKSRAIQSENYAAPSINTGVPFFGAVPARMVEAAGNNDIYIGNTLNRIYFGTKETDTSGKDAATYAKEYTLAIGSNDGFFYGRVQVCDRDPTSYALKDKRFWELCTRYADGAGPQAHANYKPTGAIQKYAHQLRLAAFGYLLDQSQNRYGGVLRAPMKYVGSKTFDADGVDNTPASGNPHQEWDPITGVFLSNPDGNFTVSTADGRGVYLSGVINYLNQFGRTGAIAGKYKRYDPVGELHYEALRYLQGLPPSSAAVQGISKEMYDGFPVASNAASGWTDPYGDGRRSDTDYSCMKSNIVVIGDTNTHDGNRIPAASASNNIPDIQRWWTLVSDFERNDRSKKYTDGAGLERSVSNPNVANYALSPSGRGQIIGSAYWAHTHDIRGTSWTNATPTGAKGTSLQRPGLRVKTFTFDVNEYGDSNNASTRRTSNQLFMAAKYGGFETDPSNAGNSPYNTWGNPFKREDGIDDNLVWQDTDNSASRKGEAGTYFLQSDARAVLRAFDNIFARASTSARSIAGAAIQTKNLTSSGSLVYQGSFDTSDWSGDLIATPIHVDTNNTVSLGKTAAWSAAARLSAIPSPAETRKIFVGNAGAGARPTAAPFTWLAIENELKDALNRANPQASPDNLGTDRLNFLRGDSSKEGTMFRRRNTLMGDIVNSGVSYVGAPRSSINEEGYADFYKQHQQRTPAVYVGANDGMLHAFHAKTGDELFAYIPSWLGPKLSALSDKSFTDHHQSYVDGTPVIAEAQLTNASWKTILVSGTGAGGRGVFALDVSDPASFDASRVLWEFTHHDDPDLGYVVGKPQILKFRTGTTSTGVPTYKWFAVFGSGVNNYVSDNGIYSATGSPALFMLDVSKPVGSKWERGVNYHKVSLPVDSALAATMATGLINFKAPMGWMNEVTQIFMGDLHGNMWKLDFSKVGAADWNLEKLSYFKQGSNNKPLPMFKAKDTAGHVQPISAAPSIVYGPVPDSAYVLFGTGKYLEAADKLSGATQSVYMLYDNASSALDSKASEASSAISSRKRLQTGAVDSTRNTVNIPDFVLGRPTKDASADKVRAGWVFDLQAPKERLISGATVYGDRLIFSSLTPPATSSAACSPGGGGGKEYSIHISTGNGTLTPSVVGILGEPLVVDIASAITYSETDSTGRRVKTIVSKVLQQGSTGLAAGAGQSRTVVAGRLSWRQINNYQDLKNSP